METFQPTSKKEFLNSTVSFYTWLWIYFDEPFLFDRLYFRDCGHPYNFYRNEAALHIRKKKQ